MYRIRFACIAAVWSGLALSSPAKAKESIEDSLRRAFAILQEQQDQKTQNTLTSLTEQVQGDLEPEKRMQAAILLAAHHWETNFRLSRHYLGVAESLKNPTIPELKRFEPEIEHLKIRFRHAVLLDRDTKLALEEQLKALPPEPLRHSLVEMLLETNQALGLSDDYLDIFRRYYTSYPRTVRKDKFLRKAAEIHRQKGDRVRYFQQLESLLDQYPVTEEAQWALDQLLRYALIPDQPHQRYAFTFGLLKKVYRNASHDPSQQKRIAEVFTTPLRRNNTAAPERLDTIEMIRFLSFLGIYEEALQFAQNALQNLKIPARTKVEIRNWIAYIHSEKGDHQAALDQFKDAPVGSETDLFIKEAAAKSHMSSQNFAEAAKRYRALLASRDHHRYRWYYFWNALASGRVDLAKNFLSRTPERMFNEREFRKDAATYWRGRTLMTAGRLPEARNVLAPLLQRANPGYYGNMAHLVLQEGEALARKNNRTRSDSAVAQDPEEEAETPTASTTGLAIPASFPNADAQLDARSAIEGIPFASHVFDIAKVVEVDPLLILSIIRSESAFNSKALSSAGAQGLMQIMPYTAVRLARLLDDQRFSLDQLQMADRNLLYGSLYLTLLLRYYDGHPIPAVAAYNAGPAVVNKWLRECRNCPVDAFVEFIPFGETRNYVKKVMSTYTSYRGQASLPPDFGFLLRGLPQNLPRDVTIF